MLTLKSHQLKAALNCAATKDVRYYLNGIALQCIDEQIYILASDGHMLFAGKPDAMWTGEVQRGPWTIIIDSATVKAACKTGTKEVTLSALPNGKYSLGATIFSPVDGRFPDRQKIVPSKTDGAIAQFDPRLLVNCAKALGDWQQSKGPVRPYVAHNGNSAAIVTTSDKTAFCIVMPCRIERGASPFEVSPISKTFTEAA
jgi:DNA polymerase-3 subunit beta